jgi:hypothetical protein
MSMPSNYASNVVACKLSDLVGSPPKSILGVAVFNHLSSLYAEWRCWVYSEWEFQTFAASEEQWTTQDTFALVPQLEVPGVGRVDFAIFVPQISSQKRSRVSRTHARSGGQRIARCKSSAFLSFALPLPTCCGTALMQHKRSRSSCISNCMRTRRERLNMLQRGMMGTNTDGF